jgi:hypothetical protein
MNTLPSGTTGFFNEANQWVGTGSRMGRQSWRGHGIDPTPVKCTMRKLRWVDGGYDEQGAYWGRTPGTHIYWCNFDIGDTNEDIFVRAESRDDAKEQVRVKLPNARFYR